MESFIDEIEPRFRFMTRGGRFETFDLSVIHTVVHLGNGILEGGPFDYYNKWEDIKYLSLVKGEQEIVIWDRRDEK